MPMPGRRSKETWARSHQPVLQEKCPSLGDLGGSEPAKCLAGVCLCTWGIAKQAMFLGGRLLANMKATFAPSSGSRTLLLEGRIVLELIGEPMVENRRFDELVDLQDQYLLPFRATFFVVVPGEASPEIPAGGPQVRPGEKILIQGLRQSLFFRGLGRLIL